MRIIIHRGTNQIGGCLTEIKSNNGTRILIDIGANLPDKNGIKKPEIELDGLTIGKPSFDAVFVTHYHGDHIGLYKRVNKKIPIYIGKITRGIFKIVEERLSLVNIFSKEDLEKIEQFRTFTIKDKIIVNNDIKITPISTDHSAFDSYMFLIEADGQRILHTGDFRTHGQRGKKSIEAIKKYVKKVDCLICEGTMFTRNEEEILKESKLQKQAEEIFSKNKYNFILCSSTNIDRIAAFHKAAINSHKMFICDKYQEDILEYVSKNSKSTLYKFNEGKDTKVYCYAPNMLDKMKKYGFVMLVRANDNFKGIINKFENVNFIYSQWLGYLKSDNKEYEKIKSFVPKDYKYLHTSGHATLSAIKNVINITKPDVVIPIHTEDKYKIKELSNKAKILEDNEEYNLDNFREEKMKRRNKVICKLSKMEGITIPVNIKFTESCNKEIINLEMNYAGIINDMQKDAAAFEAWSLLGKARGYKKVFLDLDKNCSEEKIVKENKLEHYNRFLYRVMCFKKLFTWFEISDELQNRVNNFYNKYLNNKKLAHNVPNVPKEKSNSTRITKNISENDMENFFEKNTKETNKVLGIESKQYFSQLPVGLFFDKKPYGKHRIFTGGKSAIDLWSITDNVLNIIELKIKTNTRIGVLSEIFFYTCFARDVFMKNIKPFNETDIRGFDKIKDIKKVRAYILIEKGHKHLEEAYKELIKVNKKDNRIEFANEIKIYNSDDYNIKN